MGRSGDAARSALLDTAERLFAERGIEAVSMREVSGAAGQRNHSAAQYHFGDKESLVAAVFQRRMQTINERRHRLIDAFDADGRTHDPRALAVAAVVPLVETVCEARAWYARFLLAARWNPTVRRVRPQLEEASSVRHLNGRMHEAMSELPETVRAHRIAQLEAMLVIALADWEQRNQAHRKRLSMAALAAELVANGESILRNPYRTSVEDGA